MKLVQRFHRGHKSLLGSDKSVLEHEVVPVGLYISNND